LPVDFERRTGDVGEARLKEFDGAFRFVLIEVAVFGNWSATHLVQSVLYLLYDVAAVSGLYNTTRKGERFVLR
jgi:hypothetical protein